MHMQQLGHVYLKLFERSEHIFNSNIYYVSLSCAFYMKRRFWTSSCRAGTGPQCCYARLSCVWWSSPQSCYKFRTSCFCLGIQQIQFQQWQVTQQADMRLFYGVCRVRICSWTLLDKCCSWAPGSQHAPHWGVSSCPWDAGAYSTPHTAPFLLGSLASAILEERQETGDSLLVRTDKHYASASDGPLDTWRT